VVAEKGSPLLGLIGRHPASASGVIVIDVMLFGASAATLGTGWAVSIPAGVAPGIATALIQNRGSPGDDPLLAAGKGILVGFLTAIPTPLPSVFVQGAGAAGAGAWIQARRNRRKLGPPGWVAPD
jgi:hypothetical protein